VTRRSLQPLFPQPSFPRKRESIQLSLCPVVSRFFIIISLCFLACGCGYSAASLLPADLDSIHVDNFVNEINTTREISNKRSSYTYWPGVENQITRAVINGFIFNRKLEIDPDTDSALLLKGTLVDIRQIPLSYSGNYNVEEFRIEIFVNIELYDNRNGELMWKEERFMGQMNYYVSGPNRMTEPEAQIAAVKDLAERIVERTVEYW